MQCCLKETRIPRVPGSEKKCICIKWGLLGMALGKSEKQNNYECPDALTSYRLFSPDIITTILVHRTKEEKVFGYLTLYYYAKPWFAIALCTNMAVLSCDWKPSMSWLLCYFSCHSLERGDRNWNTSSFLWTFKMAGQVNNNRIKIRVKFFYLSTKLSTPTWPYSNLLLQCSCDWTLRITFVAFLRGAS